MAATLGSLRLLVVSLAAPPVPLAGASFIVTSDSGSPEASKHTTGPDGRVQVQLPAGNYSIKQESAPGNFDPPEGEAATQKVLVTAGKPAELTFINVARGTLKVSVRNGTQPGTPPVQGAEFIVERNGMERDLKTDKDGFASVLLPPGDYSVTQTTTPEGLALPQVPTQNAAVVSAATKQVDFVNLSTGSLEIRAAPETEATTALPGALFIIELVGATDSGRQVVTQSGPTVVSGLAPGNYTVTEQTPPAEHSLPADSSRTATVSAVAQAELVFLHKSLVPPVRGWQPMGAVSGLVTAVLLVWAGIAGLQEKWPWLFAGLITGLGLGLLALLGGKRYGFFKPLIGVDGRTSTSKVQVGLWTFVLVWAVAFLLGRVLFDGQELSTVLPETQWQDYLVLLGGPFAAAVLASAFVSWRVENGTLQKTVNQTSQAEVDQIFKNDSGDADLVDAQYLLFNIVALGYFIVGIAREPILPDMPPVLLALTSGAAALYVANKAVESNKPTITGVVPATLKKDSQVTIFGQNFRPASGTALHVSVDLEGFGSVRIVAETGNELTVAIPPGIPAGLRNLRVTSTGGVTTAPWPVLASDE